MKTEYSGFDCDQMNLYNGRVCVIQMKCDQIQLPSFIVEFSDTSRFEIPSSVYLRPTMKNPDWCFAAITGENNEFFANTDCDIIIGRPLF
jgi:hypothetical protein